MRSAGTIGLFAFMDPTELEQIIAGACARLDEDETAMALLDQRDLEAHIEGRPLANEHAARIKDPGGYDQFRRQNDAGGTGVHFIFGIKTKPKRTSELQSIHFDAKKFTEAKARKWLADHGYKAIEFEAATGEDEKAKKSTADAGLEKRYRTIEIRQDDIDEDARTVKLAFSSEFGVKRWFGKEILSHNPRHVRLQRLRNGGAFLLNHNAGGGLFGGADGQIGVVEKASIDSDKMGRAVVRFSRSERAREIFEDVVDGIRRHISVGYLVHKQEPDERDEQGRPISFRVTDWEPMEISLVSIPADPTVGVGRADDDTFNLSMEARAMPDKDPGQARTPDPNETAAQQAAARQKTLQDERERVSNITAIGRKFKLVEEADKAIEEGTSTEAFNRMALDRIDNTNHSPSNVQPARPEHTNRVIAMPRYAKLRAFTGEQAEERAYRSGMWLLAQLWGNEKAQRWCNENGLEVRALTTGITSLGGALVPDVLSNAIIDLREDFGVFRRECRVIPMSTDTLIVPRRTGGLTAYFVGDNDEITASDKSWDQVQLVAKKLGALSLYSSELAEDAVISLADDLARELAYAFASKEDDCGFNGDGTSTFGGMQGVVTKLTVEALAGAVTAATNNDTFAELDASDLASVMAALPQYAHANAKWYCSLACFELVFSRLMAAAGGNTVDLLTGKVRPMYLGYPVVITQKMATSAGDLSELVMLMFGDLRLAAMMGARREIRVMVSEERYFEKDQIGIRATERFDIVVHDIGDNTNAGPIVSLIGD